MDWDRIEGNWKQFTGKIKEKWGQLTDDDWQKITGKKEQLVGQIQTRYGIAKEQAEDFKKKLEAAGAKMSLK